MRYGEVIPARFLFRPNRFVALVEAIPETAPGSTPDAVSDVVSDAIPGTAPDTSPEGMPDTGKKESVLTVHIKNTGRCRELLIPGARVYLNRAERLGRKTVWDLIAVEKEIPSGPLLVNMDAQAPNRVFAEWAAAGGFLPDISAIRPEVRFGESRLDFCLDTSSGPHYVEVKGVTLEEDGAARFPDAPTERGVKHIRELERAVEAGASATLFFVVQMSPMRSMSPNDVTDPAFGAALREAVSHGVGVCAWECAVTPESLTISREVPVKL